MSTYPSIVATLTNPNAGDKLNAPSHSSIHSAANNEIVQMETFVGTLSSAVGTLVYDIRAAASNGGGHVQTANKGGTGQTSYNKGDLLTGQSSSVLSKLAVGTDGQVLQANSSAISGVNWVTNSSPKIFASASPASIAGSTSETSVLSVSIPGSTIGTSNVIRATVNVKNLFPNALSDSLTLRGNYGSTSFATVIVGSISGGTNAKVQGTIEMEVYGNGAVSSQVGVLKTVMFNNLSLAQSSFVGMQTLNTNPISVDSGGVNTLGLTAQWSSTNANMTPGPYVVERVV